jgi:hypothetical protein
MAPKLTADQYAQTYKQAQSNTQNQPVPQPVQPQNSAEWDYKKSPVNNKGESLPSGAEGWTPFGQPYFGAGIKGTLKRYAWSLMGSPTQGDEEERWGRFLELTGSGDFWSNPLSEDFVQAGKELAGGMAGTDASQETAGVDWNKVKEASARLKQIEQEYKDPTSQLANLETMPDEVRAEYQELKQTVKTSGVSAAEGATSFKVGGQNVSLLSPLLRGSKVAVQVVLDVLSEASVKFEQTQGVGQAMREFADDQGGLPGLSFDIDTKANDNSEAAQNTANIASRVVMPVLAAWDAFRFITAPGTLKQKQEAISNGWDAGRILYSQAIKPSLMEEYKRRAAAGEDPQLLAMELQNPWAEAIGQAVLDPLNFVGMFTKGAKVANMLDKATDAVRGGSLGDEAADLLRVTAAGETRAAEQINKFDDLLVKNVDRIEGARLTPNYNKLTSYSPSGMRVRETKVVQTTSQVVTSSIMRNGGTAEDVADFMHNLSRATSKDKAVRLAAWDELFTMSNRYGLGRYAFSDDVLESGILLRNLVEDGDLLKVLQAGKGDLAETAKILDRTFQKAIAKQIPTFSEVKKGAEAFRLGDDTAEAAAQTFDQINPTAKALWNLQEGTVGNFKQKVNTLLGKFYFARPGFAVRNAMNNMFTMITDSGLQGTAKSYYRDGKFWSMQSIDDDLMKYFGGKLPPATGGISSMAQAEDSASWVTKFNDNIEAGFAKRIYWSRFRDTMDKFLTPGVALPSRQEFKALGLTDDGIDHFVHVLKHETYGNVDEAISAYSKKFGDGGLLDTWKRWNGSISPEEMKGLSETGLVKELDEITNTAKTPQQIKERIAALKRELQTRANSAADNPVGVNRERGHEFMEDVGKAEREGLLDTDGTNRLNILIEQGDKAQDELMQAIGKARDITQDPALRQQFGVMEEAFSASRRTAVRTTSQNLATTAVEAGKKSRKLTGLQIEQMWNESILAKRGPAPAGLNRQRFMEELWQATREEISGTWEVYFSEGMDKLTPLIDNLTQQFPEMQSIFQRAQKSSAELQMYRTAIYRDGKIFYSQPPKNVRELASRYGIPTATPDGRPQDKQLLATINKYGETKYKTLDEVPLEEAERALQAQRAEKGGQAAQKAPQAAQQPELPQSSLTPNDTTQVPRSELPTEVSSEFERIAKELQRELFEGEAGKRLFTEAGVIGQSSTNADWYKELYRQGLRKQTVDKALEKVVIDAGKDVGKTVERVKELIVERIRYGDPKNGIPPNLKILQAMGADPDDMARALDDYNDITRQSNTLEDLLGKDVQLSDEAAELAPDTSQPYYDDAGNLIEPKNPEVEIAPPYVDASPPLPGQMWNENSDGILAALNKVERHMLDNYGLKAAEKLDGGQVKALANLLKESKGRVTEGIAIADKIGKEWRDFALLPYGETKNLDLMMSYAFPYQFWYSRSYSNWMKRVATDPQVIANYARIKETMSKVNKDSPEWWRYNVEVPSHFLGLPNEHPMSFNIEANIWPLYGLTGTDFNDPMKRTNWLTATVDDMGKFGPSVWSPIQWAIATYYKAQGEEEVAQSWAGRIIPQTADFKAVSSYFGQPIELDPAVQMFSGKGFMDLQAMDKHERNRVGRSIAAMVQEGLLTEEQGVEVSRTQEGPVWDEAVRRATQLRAPGQIMSFFLGVGMKARTEEDRITDEFYQEYYRLNNLNEADLISPADYQKSWDGLREKYPFMDALLLSRKAGPDRDRAYAYNVLGRIPPGQASELYRLVGIDPETAQKFYDSKGNIAGMSESDRSKFMGAMVDLGAMLAIPEFADKAEWNDARTAYKGIQEQMKQNFGSDIQDKIDVYFSMDDADERKAFIENHPEVQGALNFQNEQTVNDELLYEYYGGIQALERYHKGKMYDALYAKFGNDIGTKYDEYYMLQMTDPAGAKRFYRSHPELKAYSAEKKKMEQDVLKAIVTFGSKLPEPERPELTGNEPQSAGQQAIANYASQSTPSFSYWQAELPEVSAILQSYWFGGQEIPYAVTKNLDYMASNYGFQSGDDMLQAILISMNK